MRLLAARAAGTIAALVACGAPLQGALGACPTAEDLGAAGLEIGVSSQVDACNRLGTEVGRVLAACEEDWSFDCLTRAAQANKDPILRASDACRVGLCRVQGFIEVIDALTSCDDSADTLVGVIVKDICQFVSKATCQRVKDATKAVCDGSGVCHLQISTIMAFSGFDCPTSPLTFASSRPSIPPSYPCLTFDSKFGHSGSPLPSLSAAAVEPCSAGALDCLLHACDNTVILDILASSEGCPIRLSTIVPGLKALGGFAQMRMDTAWLFTQVLCPIFTLKD